MFRIRFHGRGGQGMKTAANILGSAFFAAGYQVQDAPRYGAERRGAPMTAYVRAGREPIVERGAIAAPDLVVVADRTLLDIAAAAVLQGVGAATVLLIASRESAESIVAPGVCTGRVVTLHALDAQVEWQLRGHSSVLCAGAAARLVGVLSREVVQRALVEEGAVRGPAGLAADLAQGLAAYDALAAQAGSVTEGATYPAEPAAPPEWIELRADPPALAAPDVYAPANSVQANTGLWRSLRPVIDYTHCSRCSWVCSTLCPDSAIRVDADRTPHIDYEHCKGCMICVAVCPPHAIQALPEAAGHEGHAA